MPKHWYDRHAIKGDDETAEFNRRIVADKKPYFMRYRYGDLLKDYNEFLKHSARKAQREFNISIDELLEKPIDTLTEDERRFVHYYNIEMPVSTYNCTMNRICKRIEDEFDRYLSKYPAAIEFDPSIFQSGCDINYRKRKEVETVYNEYVSLINQFLASEKKILSDVEAIRDGRTIITDEFLRRVRAICSNDDELTDIIVDVCYRRGTSKQFVWDICKDTIIRRLLEKNDMTISFPVLDDHGDFTYGGNTFKTIHKRIGVNIDEDNIE